MKFRCQPVSGTVLAVATVAGVAIINVNPTLLANVLHVLMTATAQSAGPNPPFVSGCRLVDPPELVPSDPGAPGQHTLDVDLTVQAGTVNVSGDLIRTHVYNEDSTVTPDPRCFAGRNAWLPPTLRIDPGDRILLKLRNAQTDTQWHTNLHFHGLHVSPGMDESNPSVAGDDTFVDIAPATGSSEQGVQLYDISVPANHPVGTYWYHGHFRPEEPQIHAGESGLIKIGSLDALLPPALQHLTTHTLMLRDLQFHPDTNTVVTDNIDSNAPTTRLVNDMLRPYVTMGVGETQHWVLANTGADLFYDVQFDGHPFWVIGMDGNPVWRVEKATHLVLPPARRVDVLVRSTGRERADSSYTIRTRRYVQGSPGGDVYPEVPLATVRFAGDRRAPQASLPSGLVQPPAAVQISDRRHVYFNEDQTTGNFAINTVAEVVRTRIPLDPVFVPTGASDVSGEWTIVNTTFEGHPFHMHVNPFQVIATSDPADRCPNALKPFAAASLQDTVVLPQSQVTPNAVQCPGDPAPTTKHYGQVVIRTTWRDFFGRSLDDPQGRIMLHCHIAGHFDNGMLTWFEVVRR